MEANQINPLSRIPAPNLANQVVPEKVTRPAGFWKSAAMDVLVVLSATGFSFLLFGFYAGRISWIWLLLGFTFLLLCSAFEWLLTPDRGRRFFVMLLSALGLVSWFFMSEPFVFVASTAGVAFIFMFLGDMTARGRMANSVEFKFSQAIAPQMNRYLTGILLAAVLLYLPQWNAENSFLSRSAFHSLYNATAGFGEKYYLGEVKLTGNVSQFAKTFADYNFRSTPGYLALPLASRARAADEASGRIIEGFSQMIGQSIEPNEPMHAVFYNFMISKMNDWQDKFQSQFLFVWGVAVFFLLRGLAAVYYLLVIAIAFVVYQMLLGMNFIRVTGESCTREVVEYS